METCFSNKRIKNDTAWHWSLIFVVVTFPSSAPKQKPLIFPTDKSNDTISVFSFIRVSLLFIIPLITISSYLRVVILHPHKRATRFRIGTIAIGSRSQMGSMFLVFAAVESQLSSFMAFAESNNNLLWRLLISWYDDSSEYRSEDGLSTTSLETRSQPPGKKKWNELKFLIFQNDIAFHLL